ncbi:hypothetical protein BC936DRAFT_140638 [Jimgerdemannia flammicorona]|uniref:Uncharacterized protein n=1 Tax=Jimgerdemannia flammicorona TaxID=994334 RepID=A0A433AHN4_9FUNG|nr:hypothetical protein BC936DRAFT_140638 [Jimgerdemannia flammicorona]
MAQYQYDEQGVTFYYFVLSFLVLVLIPSTFSFLYSALFAEEDSFCSVLDGPCSGFWPTKSRQ